MTSEAQTPQVADLEHGAGVVIRGLRRRYGDTIALADLDLEALPGRILGVAGPNGAGKSTMVKILAGEEVADSGDITIDGEAWSAGLGWLEETGMGTRMIMQVHDELVLEVPQAELELVKLKLPELMAGVAQLKVPLLAEVGIGSNWDEAH